MSDTRTPELRQRMAAVRVACLVQRGADGLTHEAREWAQAEHRSKLVLVMLGNGDGGDPEDVARMPWASLSERQRQSFRTVNRELRRGLPDWVG